jgi:3',5'-cyclic AMP phosphodiesterase CpdA
MRICVLLLFTIAFVFAPQCDRGPKQPSGNAVTFVAAGDFGMTSDASATLEMMSQARPDFILALGDLSYSATRPESDWCDYVRSKVGPTLPFQLMSGNHEDDFGKEGEIRKFAACLPDKMRSTGKYPAEYYFDLGKLARFIAISPDLTIGDEHFYYGHSNSHYQWLAKAIDDARGAGVQWVIVAMHKNCLSMGSYYCNVYADLMNLLVSKKVDLVLQGHDHTYQRTKQLALGPACTEIAIDSFNANCIIDDGADNRYRKGKGPVFVTAGTGGGELFEINTKDSEAGYFVKWMGANIEPRKGFVKVVVSRNEISAEFVGSTMTSNFTDSFVITVN